GHRNVFKINNRVITNGAEIVDRIGGRVLFDRQITINDLNEKISGNYEISCLKLTEDNIDIQLTNDKTPLYIIRNTEKILFNATDTRIEPVVGDIVVSLVLKDK